MTIKKIGATLIIAASFGLVACDDSTSASSDEPTVESSDSKTASSSNESKDATSSSSEAKDDDSSSSVQKETSSSSAIVVDEDAKKFFEAFGIELPECEKNGDTYEEEVAGANIQFVCSDGEWLLTSSMSEIIADVNAGELEVVLQETGMSIYDIISFKEATSDGDEEKDIPCEEEGATKTFSFLTMTCTNGVWTIDETSLDLVGYRNLDGYRNLEELLKQTTEESGENTEEEANEDSPTVEEENEDSPEATTTTEETEGTSEN